MKIALLGANGLLGQDIQSHIPDPVQVTLLKYGHDSDIGNAPLIDALLSKEKPDWVINTAAYNNVDMSETDPLAFRVNAEGPSNLAAACQKLGIPLIHFSTDYVFPHRETGFFTEMDATNPQNKYGLSKLRGEWAVQKWEKHFVLRVSALYGKGRTNHANRVIEGLKNSRTMDIVNDLYFCPTYTAHLAQWVWKLITNPPPYGLYHLVHSGVCTRYEFAQKIVALTAPEKNGLIRSVSLQQLNLSAPRPKRAPLSNEKWGQIMGKLPSWEEGLNSYLKDLALLK